MKGSNQDVLHIAYDNVPKVLMLGNGINRAYSFASWDDLIRSIQTRELSEDDMACVKKIPYPMQPVILTNDHLGTRMRDISGALSALRAPCLFRTPTPSLYLISCCARGWKKA